MSFPSMTTVLLLADLALSLLFCCALLRRW